MHPCRARSFPRLCVCCTFFTLLSFSAASQLRPEQGPSRRLVWQQVSLYCVARTPLALAPHVPNAALSAPASCICSEHNYPNVTAHMHGDVNAVTEYGFNGIKLDGCGEFLDLTWWADLLNATGRPILIEKCVGPDPRGRAGKVPGSEEYASFGQRSPSFVNATFLSQRRTRPCRIAHSARLAHHRSSWCSTAATGAVRRGKAILRAPRISLIRNHH